MLLETIANNPWLTHATSKFWLLSELESVLPPDTSRGFNKCPDWIYNTGKNLPDKHQLVVYPVKGGYKVTLRGKPPLIYTESIRDSIKADKHSWIHTRTSGWPLKSSYIIALIGLIDRKEFSFPKSEFKDILGLHSECIPRIIEVLETIGVKIDEYTVENRKHCIISK